jgi:exo-beta-1,3-glucanase (GH17 family)
MVARQIQGPDALLEGQVMAVAYSGFREGQHPDRGQGAVNPRRAEILEDLQILAEAGFRLIRLYDAGANSRTVLELIAAHELPFKVLLGIWLEAEISNHEGCAWLTEPIADRTLAANARRNIREVGRGVELARAFPQIVVAVSVGNEALIDWTDHMLTVEGMIAHVRRVRSQIDQPVTVAENYERWAAKGAPLAAELDFIGVHTYPLWEGKAIDEGLTETVANVEAVRRALPDRRIAILEAGWATTATEFGDRAGEAQQARYYHELSDWARGANVTVFFFEAFDEPWKGDPDGSEDAEKHWGLYDVDRTPKQIMR